MLSTNYSTGVLAQAQLDREHFLRAFHQAVVRSEPTDRLELACLLLGVTPAALRRIRELAEAGTIPAYRKLEGEL